MNDKEFFENIADKWDEICFHPTEKTRHTIDQLGILKGDNVLDIGSGTGVTIPFILEKVGKQGSITAIDFSAKMIKIAKRKHKYENLTFVVEDYYKYKLKCNNINYFNSIVAYSCYPHFKDKEQFFIKSNSLLEKEGKLLIAHIESRDSINSIHKNIDDIKSDKLPNVNKTISLAEKYGFKAIYAKDNEEYYMCVLQKVENI